MTKPKKTRRFITGASIIALSTHGLAVAQTADDELLLEEVVVSGIRGSLKDALDTKRDGQGVVDAISAEDIGKFPDSNLAESLQRIPGVSIDRETGEGARATVRGFGAEFNLVTFNGRQMPTSSLGDDGASAPDSRSFDFGNLASEAISSVEVHKTSRADIPSGGIGANINIKTIRPLDAPGLKMGFGAKALMDASGGDSPYVRPEVSGILSYTYSDDVIGDIGIAGSFSYQDRRHTHSQFGSEWRDAFLGNEGGWGSVEGQTNVGNRPTEDDVSAVPQNGSYNISDISRERINGQVVLQYRPIETLTATVDYVYSGVTSENATSSVGIWFNHENNTSSWTDGPVAGINFYEEFFGTPSDLSYSGSLAANQSINHSVGVNVEWEATEALNLFVDYHNSSAESKPTNPYGSNMSVGTAIFGLTSQKIDYTTYLPVISYTTLDDFEDPEQRVATGQAFRNAYYRNGINQVQLGGNYDFDAEGDNPFIDSLDFGFSYVDSNIRSAFGVIQNDTWGGIPGATADDYPDELFTWVTLRDKFAGLEGADSIPEGFYTFDFEDMVAAITDSLETALAATDDQGNLVWDNPQESARLISEGIYLADYTTDRTIREQSYAGYAQVNFSFDILDRPLNAAVGLRYEHTDISSTVRMTIPTGTMGVFNEDGITYANEFYLTYDGAEPEDVLYTGAYGYFLPSVDIDYEAYNSSLFGTDSSVKLRLSYSQTLARPAPSFIRGGTDLDILFRIDGGEGSEGRPDLLPYLSENIDVSAEWYYGEASYLSVGFFHKMVKNFIGTETVNETPSWANGLIHPATGEVLTFRITQPTNSDDTASVSGWEFATQFQLGDALDLDGSLDFMEGLGLILNYTIVGSDTLYDNTQPTSAGAQFALVGLSDSANVIAFYDKYGFQARLAWNWRDTFLAGTGRDPFYREAYDQLDFSLSFTFDDESIIPVPEYLGGLTVFLEGINVTESSLRGHRRSENTAFFAYPGHARYSIGIRYTY